MKNAELNEKKVVNYDYKRIIYSSNVIQYSKDYD